MNNKIKNTAFLLLAAGLTLFLYILLHELGHMIVIPSASFLAWVIIPFAYLQGSAPANDDVTKFFHTFSLYYHPLVVNIAALCVIGISVFIMIKKRILKNFLVIFKET